MNEAVYATGACGVECGGMIVCRKPRPREDHSRSLGGAILSMRAVDWERLYEAAPDLTHVFEAVPAAVERYLASREPKP